MKSKLGFFGFITFFFCQLTNGQHTQPQFSPFNLVDVVNAVNKYRLLNTSQLLASKVNLKKFGLELNRHWNTGFSRFVIDEKLVELVNVSRGCATQTGQLAKALESHQEWALRGKLKNFIVY